MARRSYTDEEKAKAVVLYRDEGPAAVQRDLGIPKATVSRWAKAAGVRTVPNKKTAAATEAARQRWEQRRGPLANKLGMVAEVLADRILEAEPKDARSLATPLGVCIDKAELLTGRATSRDERVNHGEFEREVADLVAKVKA